jgi:hypothetical protein
MPAAKQEPLAAIVKAAARSSHSRHDNFSNAKSPDVPGRADIATAVGIVSPSRSQLSTAP